MYGSLTLSDFELAHGHSLPVCGQREVVPQDILDAHLTLAAKRKLARILRARSTDDLVVVHGDMVEVYVKRDTDKAGKWSSPRVFVKATSSAWTVSATVSRSNTMQAAVRDVHPVVLEGSFASHMRTVNDALNNAMSQVL